MSKALVIVILTGAVGGTYAYSRYRQAPPAPSVTLVGVSRGHVVESVGSTGTLQAVTTVQVGTQVSGTIQQLAADFNSLVRTDQVIARLDPSLFETQIEQARANLLRAQSDLDRLKVSLDDARTKLARARELSTRQLIARTELDEAEVTTRSIEAQIRSSQAQVTQAEASLNQNQVNLAHTVIRAPIDGIVISRNVDVGQTVAASMQAPTLFVLAADLTKMQVVANLDESDVGRIRPGQRVTFRVDAYPNETFAGTVAQVRLQPIVQQNVVTYATVIDVPNPTLMLKPGMTATVSVEIARRADVIRIPNAALRFRPTSEVFAALGSTLTQPPGFATGPGGSRAGERSAPDAPPSLDPRPSTPSLGGKDMPQGRRGFAGSNPTVSEFVRNMPAEQRQQMIERIRARGGDLSHMPGAAVGRASGPGATNEQSAGSDRSGSATTIDALFGPLPQIESRGQVWLYVDNQLRPLSLRLGISDGQFVELIEGDVSPGTKLVSSVATGAEVRTQPPGFGGFPPMMGPGGFGGPPGPVGRGGSRGGGSGR